MVPMPEATSPGVLGLGFSVSHQRVELVIDPVTRSLTGRTELLVKPHTKDLQDIRLNCRQCQPTSIRVNFKSASAPDYVDPYAKTQLPYITDIQQYDFLRERIEHQLSVPPHEELVIKLGKSIKIEEEDPFAHGFAKAGGSKRDSYAGDDGADATQDADTGGESSAQFTPLFVDIEFTIPRLRTGLHFVGWEVGDLRYPHMFTTNSSLPGSACSLFPCVDELVSRCTWDISVTCPKTLGDAFQKPYPPPSYNQMAGKVGDFGNSVDRNPSTSSYEWPNSLSKEDKALELCVIGTGEVTDEITDPNDPSKKKTSFICGSALSAQHVGFAIGPFEHIDLAKFREGEEETRLGQNAVPIHAYCLPRRSMDVENTCLPLARAMDWLGTTYGSYPFSEYRICFVDEVHPEIVHTGFLSICSNHLLFPRDIIDPIQAVTRRLVHALASQWIGVHVIPKDPEDIWVVAGMSYYMTDTFMKTICGNNEYRYNQKRASDRVVELDFNRPSLIDTGRLVDLHEQHAEFMNLKAPLVLFILDQRLKKSGQTGVLRVINKLFINVKTGDLIDAAITHSVFVRQCERLGHCKLQSFFEQWVEGVGCPKFRVQQRFNKKKLVVEMSVHQVQTDHVPPKEVSPETFIRDMREDSVGLLVEPIQPVFTGQMTIRIHEADGTPYEHIIEIKESVAKFDVPYNTKYKRLKRTRRQKEKALTAVGADYAAEGTDDALLYCLGDVLQSEEEIKDWKLQEWDQADEDKMSQESYEWIRIDADFEWICKTQLQMAPYMWVSQLQQDRDVVAQLQSIQWLAGHEGHPLISTICVRTLMDHRYFHGIRTSAAAVLAKSAKDEIGWIGLFHLEKAFQQNFCYPGSPMPRRNDFSDQASYYLQSAILRTISKVHDNSGRAPMRVRSFLLDKLKFNDNSSNPFSDNFYVATLIQSLAETVASAPPLNTDDNDYDLNASIEDNPRFYATCLEEIERYRRVDEWVPSYHNILSTTALDAKSLLIQAGIVPFEAREFVQYTANTTSDLLCLSAFSNLLKLGSVKSDAIIRWFLFVLGNDSSSYIREEMFTILGHTLGALAIGIDPSSSTSTSSGHIGARKAGGTATENGGLVIEQEDDVTIAARAAAIERKENVRGALSALKKEISDYKPFQEGLWGAITSPMLTLNQMGQLLELCDHLYESKTRGVIILRYPRYWQCEKVGKGKVKFSATGRVRITRMPEIKARPSLHTTLSKKNSLIPNSASSAAVLDKPPSNTPAASSKPKLSLKFSSSSLKRERENSFSNDDLPSGYGTPTPGFGSTTPTGSAGGMGRPLFKPPKPKKPTLTSFASTSSGETLSSKAGVVKSGSKDKDIKREKLKISLGGGKGGNSGGERRTSTASVSGSPAPPLTPSLATEGVGEETKPKLKLVLKKPGAGGAGSGP